MIRSFAHCFAALTMISLLTGNAWAVVTHESVTPASVKGKDSKFSVKAEKREDSLTHFTITYRLPAPQYLVAHFEMRDGEATLVKSDTPSFVREASATYHVALLPKRLADSKFELSENSFGESSGHPVAVPGGTIFLINLEAFGKDGQHAKNLSSMDHRLAGEAANALRANPVGPSDPVGQRFRQFRFFEWFSSERDASDFPGSNPVAKNWDRRWFLVGRSRSIRSVGSVWAAALSTQR